MLPFQNRPRKEIKAFFCHVFLPLEPRTRQRPEVAKTGSLRWSTVTGLEQRQAVDSCSLASTDPQILHRSTDPPQIRGSIDPQIYRSTALSLLTFLAHAVIVAFVVEATVVKSTLMLSQVTARTLKQIKSNQGVGEEWSGRPTGGSVRRLQ